MFTEPLLIHNYIIEGRKSYKTCRFPPKKILYMSLNYSDPLNSNLGWNKNHKWKSLFAIGGTWREGQGGLVALALHIHMKKANESSEKWLRSKYNKWFPSETLPWSESCAESQHEWETYTDIFREGLCRWIVRYSNLFKRPEQPNVSKNTSNHLSAYHCFRLLISWFIEGRAIKWIKSSASFLDRKTMRGPPYEQTI